MNRTRPLSYYLGLNYPFRAQIDPDDGSFYVDFPDLPGCMSDGDTPEEAIANVQDAIGEWIDAANKIGRLVPKPSRKLAPA